MATYVIGDIQGCIESLQALLERCLFTPQDRLWCVGDLVNRGPYSLEVLEFLIALGDQVQVVLGNHDIHLLACAAGASPSRGDTLEPILNSPRRDELLGWLRTQPLLFEENGYAMVHAGINPDWSWDEVRARATRAHHCLLTQTGLAQLVAQHPSRRAEIKHESSDSWIDDLAWFTRVRFIHNGSVDERIKGGPEEAGPQDRPWYELYEQSYTQESRPLKLFVGHWAALGVRVTPHLVSLDSGCIWGRYLTAMRLEDGALFMQSTLEKALIPKNQRVHG